MKLWILKVLGDVDYDEYRSIVMRADSEEKARALTVEYIIAAIGEYSNAYDFADPELSSCKELTSEGIPGMIITDFNQG